MSTHTFRIEATREIKLLKADGSVERHPIPIPPMWIKAEDPSNARYVAKDILDADRNWIGAREELANGVVRIKSLHIVALEV
jgi:hypothetical protein